MCGVCGCSEKTLVKIEQDILSENQQHADSNHAYFKAHNINAINLVSSPGSGKTTLLEKSLSQLNKDYACAVIEGDQLTERDAERIRRTGTPVKQINTGKTCHLDAHMISHAHPELNLKNNSILFIENVGNLVCPALFDLGETARVVILSVTEGDDKPLKYAPMFHDADLMIINKIDLLPYVDFDVNACIDYAKQINENISVIQTSATTGQGLDAWLSWLTQQHATESA